MPVSFACSVARPWSLVAGGARHTRVMERRAGSWLVVALLVVLCGACAAASAGARTLRAEERPEPTDIASAVSVRDLPPLPVAAAAVVRPMFASTIAEIDEALAERMRPSWRPGCPVPLGDLRYVTVTYVDFEGRLQTGELVVHADVAEGVVGVFAALFDARYPVRQMRLIDDFDADDTASIYADNTSAFNCRAVTGGTTWSEHAYGRAIDINPVENPYVSGSQVGPRTGRPFLSRPDAPGVIHPDDVVVRAFADAGWQWGGYWDSPIDYQHFSTSGR
jgi:poly-gamma-glutamate synthesis protein (capsule biosynthesis protein)